MSVVQENVDEFESESLLSSERPSSAGSAASKTELIQRILDSLKVTPSIRIYLSFTEKNQLGLRPQLDDLFEKIAPEKSRSLRNMTMDFQDDRLNQTLSAKEKASLLRILLRREQIVERYLNQSNST